MRYPRRLLLILTTLTPAFGASPLSISGPNAFGAVNTSISAGTFHTCAIRSDSTLACWGDDRYSNLVPSGTFVQVAAGTNQTCAIRTNNTVVCWGYSGEGAANAGPSTAGRALMQLAVGGGTGCALGLNGQVTCWGRNNFNQARPPTIGVRQDPVLFRQIAVGYSHACGIKFDGTIACWGGSPQETGAGTTTPPAGTYREIAAGESFTCAIAADGSLRCWGVTAAPPGGQFRSLTAGNGHACGIRQDGAAACWGNTKNFGQLNPPAGRFLQLAAGYLHTCGIAESAAVVCWGSNSDYELYPGQGVARYNQSTPPAGGFRRPSVAAGLRNSCFIANGGAIRCFGSAGDNTPPPGGNFIQISIGTYGICAVATSGQLVCWGYDMPAPPGVFTQVAVGTDTACGIRIDGTIACARQNVPGGAPDDGQGRPPAGQFLQIGGEESTFCATRVDGTSVCWGRNTVLTAQGVGICTQASGVGSAPSLQISGGRENSFGLLPNGANVFVAGWGCGSLQRTTPPPGSGNFSQFSLGDSFGCALRVDGSPVCWGDPRSGQLSPPPGTYVQMGAGGFHGCGVTTAGTIVCWGANGSGQASVPSGGLQAPPPGGCSTAIGSFATDSYNAHRYSDASPYAPEGRLEFWLKGSNVGFTGQAEFRFQKAAFGETPAVTFTSTRGRPFSPSEGLSQVAVEGTATVGSRVVADAVARVSVQGNTASANTVSITLDAEEGDLYDSGVLYLPPGSIAVTRGCLAESGIHSGADPSSDEPVSPGAIAILAGEDLADFEAATSSAPMPTAIRDLRVTVNSRYAPLFSVSPTRIVFQVPLESLAGPNEIRVLRNTETTSLTGTNLTQIAPAIFLADPYGQAAAGNHDLSPNSTQNPATANSTVTLYLTGLGQTDPGMLSGRPADSVVLRRVLETPSVLILGRVAEVLYAGAAPGFVGLYQVTVRVPEGTGAGPYLPVQVLSGGRASNFATIAVR